MTYSEARLDRTAAAWNTERECWIFRRRLGKDGYEAVRLDDPGIIADDAMEVTQLGKDGVNAEAEFNTMRDRACAKAALTAGRNARS